MKKFIIPILFLFPLSVFAQTSPLSVSFNPSPLFNVGNFLPGNNKEASITIGNNTAESQNAYIEAVNISNSNNLASQMKLEIFENGNSIYDGNFETFLNAGPVFLSSVPPGNSKIYNLKITFLENASDGYQGKTLGLDICVGFAGGDNHCTSDMIIGPEDNSGRGGGGGGAGGMHLVIYNDRNDIPQGQSIIVRWETNKPSTSQVIYGSADKNYILNPEVLPFMGYDFGTQEDMSKTIGHLVVLSNLEAGKTYKYRVVSRASPATISYEHEFTVPVSGIANNSIFGSIGNFGGGEILGADIENGNGSTSTASTSNKDNLAAAFASGLGFPWWWILILVLLIYLIWRFFIKRKYDETSM
jgi:hypothetical protein